MRFQERDSQILNAIQAYDGVIARRHLKAMFWPHTKHAKALERRLALLQRAGYISWPTQAQRQTRPIPEPIVWLGWRGALHTAGLSGIAIEPPKSTGENQLRELARSLRENGFRWLREPRWIQLSHDLAVADFRLAVEMEITALPHLSLAEWIPEGAFLSAPDEIEYEVVGERDRTKSVKRLIRPDSILVIADASRKVNDTNLQRRFLLELDMATHPRSRFWIDKVIPGEAYIYSPAYKARFGYNSGRWLVVTTGPVRRDHLRDITARALGHDARVFLFSTLTEATRPGVLTEPIWWVPVRREPVALFPKG